MPLPTIDLSLRREWIGAVPGRATVLGAALIVLPGLAAVGLLHVRYALVFAALAFLLETWRAMRVLEGRSRRALLAFTLASIAIVVVSMVWRGGPPWFEIGSALVPVFLAWAFVLTAVTSSGPTRSWALEMPTTAAVPLVAAAAFWLVEAAVTGGVRPWIVDEVLYLLQSLRAQHPPFMYPFDPHLGQFFQVQLSYVVGGYLNGQYPPGWPLFLSLAPDAAARLGLLLAVHLWLVGATYGFGRAVASPRVGFLAALLLGTSGFELYYSMSFFPHVFTAALLVTSGLLLIRGLGRRGGGRFASWVVAGLLAGLAFATRPLTGLAMGAALMFLVLLCAMEPRRILVPLAAALGIGAALPMAYLMWYNRLTTGGFLRFGYAVANHGFQALGFGLRGFVMYKGHGLPVERIAPFGIRKAMQQLMVTLQGALGRLWPSGIVLPLIFIARLLRVRVQWRYAAPFALLPLAYFFYFFQSDRYFFELLPFAMVGTAWLVLRVSERSASLSVVLVAVLLCTNVGDAAAVLHNRRDYERVREPFYRAIDGARDAHSKVLVFVRDTSPGATEPILQALYAYNLEGPFHGRVVVARDIGTADTLLVDEYPGYFPVRLTLVPDGSTDDPWRWQPRITHLADDEPAF